MELVTNITGVGNDQNLEDK